MYYIFRHTSDSEHWTRAWRNGKVAVCCPGGGRIMEFLALLMFFVAGLSTGLLAGLFGLRGGLVLVPLFYLSFPHLGISTVFLMHLAVDTSLAITIFTSTDFAYSRHRKGDVLWSEVKKLAPFYAVGALTAAVVSKWISSPYLRYFFIALLISVILRALFKKGFTDDHPLADYSPPGRPVMAAFGVCTGCLSALLGIGGSPITVPFLRNTRLPMVNTVAIAATLGVPIALFGAVGYVITGWNDPGLPAWTTGYVYWPAIPGIVVGVLATVPLGTRLSHSLPDKLVARGYVVLLIAVLIAMIV
jgi:uncharacterized membrane protein YfcA